MAERLVLLFSREEIARRVRELAAAISAAYAGGDLVLVGILRGAFVFLADLIRSLTIPAAVDFIGAASYGTRAETSGEVAVTKALQLPIAGRDVLLVEDIEDIGITLKAILDRVAREPPPGLCVTRCMSFVLEVGGGRDPARGTHAGDLDRGVLRGAIFFRGALQASAPGRA